MYVLYCTVYVCTPPRVQACTRCITYYYTLQRRPSFQQTTHTMQIQITLHDATFLVTVHGFSTFLFLHACTHTHVHTHTCAHRWYHIEKQKFPVSFHLPACTEHEASSCIVSKLNKGSLSEGTFA